MRMCLIAGIIILILVIVVPAGKPLFLKHMLWAGEVLTLALPVVATRH